VISWFQNLLSNGVNLCRYAEGAFTGAGNTFPVLCIGAVCNLGRIPVAHYLATTAGWGVAGVWAAIVASQIIKALGKSWWGCVRVEFSCDP
jgi:Na+-driven multidrug efflux pump